MAYEYCEQYICQTEGVDNIKDIPFGQGFTKASKEFDSKLRQIVQLGYGLVLISHAQDKVFQNEDGTEYNRIVPTLANKARLVCVRMCDLIGYSRQVQTEEGLKTYLFLRGTPRFEAGSRFKYTPDKIEFTYKELVKAIADAIDKQAELEGNDFFTDERENLYVDTSAELDFDKLMEEFRNIVGPMLEEDQDYYAPRITEVVERHLGKGKKVSNCTRDQVMLIDIIVSDLKEIKRK